MTIEAAIAHLQGIAGDLTGMREAPAAPPESANQFPFAICYERTGETELSTVDSVDDTATIFLEIHVARQLLPAAITTAMTFRDPFLEAVYADLSLGGSVSICTGVRRTFLAMIYAGVETIGYRFEIDVILPVSYGS